MGKSWGRSNIPLDLPDTGIRAYPAPDLAQLWGTCIASSNEEMMPPVGDPWDRPNLESKVPGRGSLRLHELTPPPQFSLYLLP